MGINIGICKGLIAREVLDNLLLVNIPLMYSTGTLNKNTTIGILLRILIIIDKRLSFINTNPIILDIVDVITTVNMSIKIINIIYFILSLNDSSLNTDNILLILEYIIYCSFQTSPLIAKPVVNNKNKACILEK